MLRSRQIGAIHPRRPRIGRAGALLAALLSLVSCAARDDRRDAARVLDHHFDALAHEHYDDALADYDPRFFADVTRADWRSALVSITAKIGKVEHYVITVNGLESKQTVGPGMYLKFKCKVDYAKHTSEETFYLWRREGADEFHIVGHQIDSPGLLSR